MTKNERFLSGMRPTGFIHLKHLMVIDQWLELEKNYDCFFGIYNSLALTTAKADNLIQDTLTIFRAWLCAGLNFEQSIIFAQSLVPEHAQMFQMLLQATPVHILQRAIVPKRKKQDKEIINMGILSYPLQELADVLIFNTPFVTSSISGNVELSHKIIRNLCHNLNLDASEFVFPQVIIPPVPPIPGFDGKRTSSQRQNFICPTDKLDLIRKKVFKMPTDYTREDITYPGNPKKCCVYAYYVLPKIRDSSSKENIPEQCQAGALSCKICKEILALTLWQYFAAYREKERELKLTENQLRQMLRESTARASKHAKEFLKKYQELFQMAI
ncbi:MAG: hypothetical protein NT116_02415 [Candidatus Parcubacteria bacterium]|nr:hypothetical protein [Candidatus Parcubacteria bacterium]